MYEWRTATSGSYYEITLYDTTFVAAKLRAVNILSDTGYHNVEDKLVFVHAVYKQYVNNKPMWNYTFRAYVKETSP